MSPLEKRVLALEDKTPGNQVTGITVTLITPSGNSEPTMVRTQDGLQTWRRREGETKDDFLKRCRNEADRPRSGRFAILLAYSKEVSGDEAL